MDSTSRYGQPSRQPPPFRIRFYNDQFLRSLVDEDQPSSSNTSNGRTAKVKPAQRGQHMASKNTTGRIVTDKRTRREEQYQLQLAQQKIVQDRLNRSRILEASAKKERDFVHLVGEVAAGHSLVRELDKSLGVSDDAERSKKLKQFQEWNTNVHGVIQRRIDNALGSMDSTEINDRRRRDLETFLAITNSKTALFRDIIIESEYDPLEPNRRTIKARVSRLRDPCRRVLDKRTEENGLLSDEKSSVDREPLVRKTFEVELWEDRRVKDTPHGVFARMMGRKVGQETREVSRTYQTSFKLDDYSFERGRDVVSTEFPKGKRTFQTNP